MITNDTIETTDFNYRIALNEYLNVNFNDNTTTITVNDKVNTKYTFDFVIRYIKRYSIQKEKKILRKYSIVYDIKNNETKVIYGTLNKQLETLEHLKLFKMDKLHRHFLKEIIRAYRNIKTVQNKGVQHEKK